MKVTTAKQLSNYLKDTRLSLKLSQSKVANKVGIRQDTVSSFEQNPDSTKLETLFKLLASLNLELEVKKRGASIDNIRLDNTSLDGQDWKEEW
ncbi:MULTISPECIES: helix-turn-helix domain-containing protein [Shewanella]|uniref:Helix-turn-helix domain-containing protein n=2 Tax=Shewanella TaxID=22 RepID=A0A5B8R2K7_9GAMM|nr:MULTISPECIES: helix-turn-helix domain-containing protein [Shewanella]MDT3282533.1 helix-turn-helix domain-containing protein [Shewanella sp. SP2S1-2]QDZ92627.1 helix-turn-helix domain-containing protein [Shewanella decolorationis]UML94176.1 helix-turn-helix domain-containing protein [Shewanella xiamenensis]